MYMQMIVNLLLVVGLILVYFLLMQWLNKKKRGKISELALIASLPLGAKEKVILVEADNRRFLLGVTQQSVSCLASLGKEKLSSIDEIEPSFQDILNIQPNKGINLS